MAKQKITMRISLKSRPYHGIVLRHGSDPVLLWLWYRPAAVALILPLAWEPPYAVGAAL